MELICLLQQYSDATLLRNKSYEQRSAFMQYINNETILSKYKSIFRITMGKNLPVSKLTVLFTCVSPLRPIGIKYL